MVESEEPGTHRFTTIGAVLLGFVIFAGIIWLLKLRLQRIAISAFSWAVGRWLSDRVEKRFPGSWLRLFSLLVGIVAGTVVSVEVLSAIGVQEGPSSWTGASIVEALCGLCAVDLCVKTWRRLHSVGQRQGTEQVE